MKKKSNFINKLLIVYLVASVALVIAFMAWYYRASIKSPEFTGQELFDAVNVHRASQNISTLELDPILCDNLVERWLAVNNPDNGHKGFEEWIKGEGIQDNPKYGMFGEMYMRDTASPADAIKWWIDSPGHRTTLEMVDMKYGCAYAHEGTGVVIMATAKK